MRANLYVPPQDQTVFLTVLNETGNRVILEKVGSTPVPGACGLTQMRDFLASLPDEDMKVWRNTTEARIMPVSVYWECQRREIQSRFGQFSTIPELDAPTFDRLYNRWIQYCEALVATRPTTPTEHWGETQATLYKNQDLEYKIAREFGFTSVRWMEVGMSPEQYKALGELEDAVFEGKFYQRRPEPAYS